MAGTVTEKLIASHLLEGRMEPGEEIGLRVDQTLTQDATGTLVMLELEAMRLQRARTEVSVQYVDHNVVQEDHKNADDHLFLLSAARRFGLWFSRPGNGVSHPVHQERFGRPGKTLVGSDSHTPAAGSLGMFAVGAGGLEVALAIAGEPLYLRMPEVWGIEIVGELPPWVSAKDVILELLRRHDVDGGLGCVLEFHGPGLAALSAMDRHVIANMGTELGATTTVFPADDEVRRFLRGQGREEDFVEILPDAGRTFHREERIDLGALEPLIAMPSSPGNVKRVADVAGEPIYQAYVGSSANPGYRDIAVVAEIVKGRRVHASVSLDVNPASRQILTNLVDDGHVTALLRAGARLHQAGCNGCIGMGQAPATHAISLRTVPRNFPGRSGTREDRVCLVSPETAAASALTGVITDPRTLDQPAPIVREKEEPTLVLGMLVEPMPLEEARRIELVKGPNVTSLPELEPIENHLALPVLLKLGDDVSTDEISPAGARALPFRSNIPAIARFAFDIIDPSYHDRAREIERAGHCVVAGDNYGQGSSREHAALAPRYLGLRVVVAKSFARIHEQNLANFGVLALTFAEPGDHGRIERGDVLELEDVHRHLRDGAGEGEIPIRVRGSGERLIVRHRLTARQIEMILQGSLIEVMKRKLTTPRGE